MTDQQIPDGYYAVLDPSDPTLMTYWRAKKDAVLAWPPQARYGPTLYRRDVPAGLSGQARAQWIHDWVDTVRTPYDTAIRQAIATNTVTARGRFAALVSRCCECGRTLTDDDSRVYGIGPECRRGMPAPVLDALAHEVGRAHAEMVASEEANR